MAGAFVQQNYNSVGTVSPQSISGAGFTPPSTGNTLILAILLGTVSGGGTVSTIIDDKGNSYTKDKEFAATGTVTGLSMWSAYIDPAKGAPATITVTFSKSMNN